jgi:hypothetical protein
VLERGNTPCAPVPDPHLAAGAPGDEARAAAELPPTISSSDLRARAMRRPLGCSPTAEEPGARIAWLATSGAISGASTAPAQNPPISAKHFGR